MFERGKCRRCKNTTKKEWNYCPQCGTPTNPRPTFKFSNDIFKQIENMMGASFQRGSVPMKKGGISITIKRGGQPKVDVKTSGDYKRLEPEIRESVGAPKRAPTGKIEEPVADIRKTGSGVEISVDLPDIKENDVDVTKLENSVEIRAYSKERTFFKLVPIPRGSSVLEREFKDGKLLLTIGN
jgi:hypothetical protein